MATSAQITANLANSKLSTGPCTPEGKAVSSKNALKHGLAAHHLVVREDEIEEFESLQADLTAELDPQGTLETLTFNQILHAAWNLQRFRRLEADLTVGGLDPVVDDSAAKVLDRLNRYAARNERAYYRAIKELRTLQTNRALRAIKLEPHEEKLVPAVVSVNDITKQSHAEVTAKALDMAMKMINYETDVYRLRSVKSLEAETAHRSSAAAR